MYLMIKKLVSYHHKNNEREKAESNEVCELPIPVVDIIPDIVDKKS